VICFGCLLDCLLDNRMERRTASKQWKEGWYYSRVRLEIRDVNDKVVESYPWEYTVPGLDAAIHAADTLHGSVIVSVPVYDANTGEQADTGFTVEVWPHAILRCGDEEIEIAVDDEGHTHDDEGHAHGPMDN